MTELALAEDVRRTREMARALRDHLAELELRVDLLAKAVAGVTSGGLDRPAATMPTLTGAVCGACGADRLTEGCRMMDPGPCLFDGESA